MSETKHTPPPWAFDKALFRIHVADGDDGRTVAYIDDDVTWGDQAEADGRLIASAPDLLSALRNVVNSIALHGDGPELQHDLYKARQAIARATEA